MASAEEVMARLTGMEVKLQMIEEKLDTAERAKIQDKMAWEREKEVFKNALEDAIGKQTAEMQGMVAEAQSEFGKQREVAAGTQAILQSTQSVVEEAVRKIEGRLKALGERERESSLRGGRPNPNEGYIPQKQLMPKSFNDKPEEWRSWRDGAGLD